METKKLTPRDIMIGDWVLWKNKNVQIAAVSGIKYSFGQIDVTLAYCNDEKVLESHDIKTISPVPLTAEILSKNKFEKHYDGDIVIYTHPQGIIIEMGINYKLFDDGRFYVRGIQHRLYYVNELQHALRLCGVDKEIVL